MYTKMKKSAYKNDLFEVHVGDALAVLKSMSDHSVNCCVTSPPYCQLRDYQVKGQIGMETTPKRYINRLVKVFREVRRVLQDDGTLWVNIGDSYAQGGRGGGSELEAMYGANTARARALVPKPAPAGYKPKDLIGIPWMLAFALRADGWYLRCDIVWHKNNAMPESVTDRPTRAHEMIFLLSKSPSYYYDAAAIAEERTSDNNPCGKNSRADVDRVPRPSLKQDLIGKGTYTGFNDRWRGRETETRNKRSVWTVATKPYAEAHFATFPPDLVRPCVLAGCPIGGLVLDTFSGSGTTGEVAIEESRRYVGIELNADYAALSEKRLGAAQPPLFLESPVSKVPITNSQEVLSLG